MRRLVPLLVAVAAVGIMVGIARAEKNGRIAYAETQGTSMEPAYHGGDLVVIASEPRYRTGEVVAYRSPVAHRIVLHRIVGGDAQGYVLEGDHNRNPDPWYPASQQVIGRVVVHVPGVGGVLASRVTRAAYVALVLLVLSVLWVGPTPALFARRLAGGGGRPRTPNAGVAAPR